jgi:hypothetical protein
MRDCNLGSHYMCDMLAPETMNSDCMTEWIACFFWATNYKELITRKVFPLFSHIPNDLNLPQEREIHLKTI